MHTRIVKQKANFVTNYVYYRMDQNIFKQVKNNINKNLLKTVGSKIQTLISTLRRKQNIMGDFRK